MPERRGIRISGRWTHALPHEMLRKAAILARGGRIREPTERHITGFDACARQGLSKPEISLLGPDQAATPKVRSRAITGGEYWPVIPPATTRARPTSALTSLGRVILSNQDECLNPKISSRSKTLHNR